MFCLAEVSRSNSIVEMKGKEGIGLQGVRGSRSFREDVRRTESHGPGRRELGDDAPCGGNGRRIGAWMASCEARKREQAGVLSDPGEDH